MVLYEQVRYGRGDGYDRIMISETIIATAQDCTNQSSSSNSDKQKIIVIWLEANNTNSGSTPVISVSSEDFWKIFGPLLELLTNETSTFE